ncbi:MAG TPA: pyrimidine reductase family protein [Acidimicrobiales bacterium]|nr:pyrimidine reductase family protein [Acidimicrobiales bacterium]
MRQLFPGPVRPVDPLAPYAVERPSPASRPWVVVNMVQSVDGSTAVEGVSGPLGGAADRTIFLGLRGLADAVLVGASTVRAERYGPVRARPEARAARLARGQRPVATLAVVTRSLDLDYAAPLFTAAEAETVLLVPEDADEAAVAGASGPSAVIRVGTGSVDLARALEALRGRGVRLLVCEGGPHLNAGLAAAGLVDELCLTVSPLFAAGANPRGLLAPGPTGGDERFELRHVLEEDGFLFLRYVRSPERSAAPPPR